MKKINVMIWTIMVVAMLAITAPVSAQAPDTRTATTERYENAFNYGWVGLLGLLGLAGLVKRSNNAVREEVHQTTTLRYNG